MYIHSEYLLYRYHDCLQWISDEIWENPEFYLTYNVWEIQNLCENNK